MSATPQSTQDDDQRMVPFKVEALASADAISRGLAEAGIDRATLLEKIKELHADVGRLGSRMLAQKSSQDDPARSGEPIKELVSTFNEP